MNSWTSCWLPATALVGITVDSAAAQGRDFIEWSDTAIEKTPLVNEVLTIQQTIFDVADTLGVGAEVRAMVYAIRGAQYVATAAQGLGLVAAGGGAGAGIAASGVVASIGGFGAVAAAGVVGAVVGILAGVFGSDDTAEYAAAKKKARERLRASLLELLQPLTLQDFAAEQDKLATAFDLGASLPATPGTLAAQSKTEQQAERQQAARMAQFFRACTLALTPRQQQLLTQLLNIGRWGRALELYEARSAADKKRIGGILYKGDWTCPPGKTLDQCAPETGWPDYGQMLRDSLNKGLAQLSQRRWQGKGSVLRLVVLGAAVAAVASPAAALGAVRSAVSLARRIRS